GRVPWTTHPVAVADWSVWRNGHRTTRARDSRIDKDELEFQRWSRPLSNHGVICAKGRHADGRAIGQPSPESLISFLHVASPPLPAAISLLADGFARLRTRTGICTTSGSATIWDWNRYLTVAYSARNLKARPCLFQMQAPLSSSASRRGPLNAW